MAAGFIEGRRHKEDCAGGARHHLVGVFKRLGPILEFEVAQCHVSPRGDLKLVDVGAFVHRRWDYAGRALVLLHARVGL